ncbi:MAG: histidine kinase [Rhodospirillales bacterium]|nr:histidine kinase [Rhodospirillales bacterium]
MTDFAAAHAVGTDWKDAIAYALAGLEQVEGANLGFVYATDLLADDLPAIVAHLKAETGIADWVGGIGMGICSATTEHFDVPAIAVMTARFPEQSFHLFALEAAAPAAGAAWLASSDAPPFAIVHADPDTPETPALIEQLAQETSGFLVGGLTSSRGLHRQVAGDVRSGGISGVLFESCVAVATGLSQGCRPIGDSHIVSDCAANVLIGLDDRPAGEVFREDLEVFLKDNRSRSVGHLHAALPIAGSDLGDYLVRNILGVDAERDHVAIGAQVAIGDRVMFVRRDADSALIDLRAMVERLKRRTNRPPRAGLYVSCIARGPGMFGAPGREVELIHEVLGDFPMVGFSANGEISANRLYGYTGVLTLFL